MSSTCIQGGALFPPAMDWQFGLPNIKPEPNDSGINSGSDFHSSSPGSDHYSNNPLTPPNSEPLLSPEGKDMDVTLPPCTSPHLQRLEASLEKSLFSSKVSEGSVEDDDLEGLNAPRVNSHGKLKSFKCKQCDFVATTKLEFWNHARSHISADKLLACTKCPFVTEFKHHFEYHQRNHMGSKPFRCDKCEYACVNKSMLNSHMKSHSNIYRFRCRDCTYVSKYCHSLKIHLRKHGHTPDVVLDDDGMPNPEIIIDVNGTRRGPKVKIQKTENHPFGLPPLPLPYPFLSNQQILDNFQKMLLQRQAMALREIAQEPQVLDLSKAQKKNDSFEDSEDETTTMFSTVEAVVEKKEETSDSEEESNNNNKGEANTCQFCDITFGDAVLHTMHMGYHGYNNPFKCNMCGSESKDKFAFFLHIARVPH